MQAGKLKHSVVIEEQVEAQDSYGDTTITWDAFVTVRASLKPITSKEFFTAQQFETEVKFTAVMRYCPGITTKMRLVHNDISYNIVGVLDQMMDNRWLVLMLAEGLRD